MSKRKILSLEYEVLEIWMKSLQNRMLERNNSRNSLQVTELIKVWRKSTQDKLYVNQNCLDKIWPLKCPVHSVKWTIVKGWYNGIVK